MREPEKASQGKTVQTEELTSKMGSEGDNWEIKLFLGISDTLPEPVKKLAHLS